MNKDATESFRGISQWVFYHLFIVLLESECVFMRFFLGGELNENAEEMKEYCLEWHNKNQLTLF